MVQIALDEMVRQHERLREGQADGASAEAGAAPLSVALVHPRNTIALPQPGPGSGHSETRSHFPLRSVNSFCIFVIMKDHLMNLCGS